MRVANVGARTSPSNASMIYRSCLYVTDRPDRADDHVLIARYPGPPPLPMRVLASGSAFVLYAVDTREACVVADYPQSLANLMRLIDCTRLKHSRMFMRDLLTYLRGRHGGFRYCVLALEGARSERAARAGACEEAIAEAARRARDWHGALADRGRDELGEELVQWARTLPVELALGQRVFRNRRQRDFAAGR